MLSLGAIDEAVENCFVSCSRVVGVATSTVLAAAADSRQHKKQWSIQPTIGQVFRLSCGVNVCSEGRERDAVGFKNVFYDQFNPGIPLKNVRRDASIGLLDRKSRDRKRMHNI